MSGKQKLLAEKKNDILQIFNTMKISEIKHSHSKLAQHWIKEHDYSVSGFIDGKWEKTSKSEPNDELIVTANIFGGSSVTFKDASVQDVEKAISNSCEGFKKWQQYDAVEKSEILYRISQFIEQQNKLLTGVENLSKYGRIREKNNLQYLTDSFKYCASLTFDSELHKEWKSVGVVCVLSDYNTLVSNLWLISSLLAAGNAVLYLVDSFNLSAFLLAEICLTSGLPPGVFNVLFSKSHLSANLSNVDQIILSPTKVQRIPSDSFCQCVPCEMLPSQLPNIIIYNSADLDAAINSIFEILNITDVEEPWPVCKVYLEESIYKCFTDLLLSKIDSIFDGNINKNSFYIMGSEVFCEQLLENLENVINKNLSVTKSVVNEGNHLITAVILNLGIPKYDQDEKCRSGSGVHIELFRTFKESVAMFNTDKKGPDISIWSEEMHLALEAAHKLKTKTVWINCINLYDPSIACGSLYLNGSAVIGGMEGFFSHLSINEKTRDHSTDFQSYGTEIPKPSIIPIKTEEDKKVVKNMKLFIGGAFINSSDETFQTKFCSKNKPYAFVASASKSDVDKAVSCAGSSQANWEKMSKLKRSAIFRKAAGILNKRKEEFVTDLIITTGLSKEFCSEEVKKTVSLLSYWSNYIIHFESNTMETKLNCKVLQERYPFGVIGIQCPDKEPLLSFVFLITPAIIFGNSVVSIAGKYPTCTLMICEVFQSAGLPGGVLNVIASSRSLLTRHLSSHLSIDSIWFSEDGDNFIHNSYHQFQPKKIVNCKNITNDLDGAKILKFLYDSTYSKAIFMPMGTGFA